MTPSLSRKVKNLTFPMSWKVKFCPHELEPYCSPLYHIPDKVVPDINVLGAVVEHGIV